MERHKRIALIAHDNKKPALVEWVKKNRAILEQHELFATGTTGGLIAQRTGIPIHCFKSGPMGGDQQIGARIVEGGIDILIFLWDPMEPHPHDVDVKALLRIAVAYDIPLACSLASADFLISSPLMAQPYSGSGFQPG